MAVEKCSAKQQAFVSLVGEVLGVRFVGCSEISALRAGGLVADVRDGNDNRYTTTIDRKGNVAQATKCGGGIVPDAYEPGGRVWIQRDSACSDRVIRSSISPDKLVKARKIILAYNN